MYPIVTGCWVCNFASRYCQTDTIILCVILLLVNNTKYIMQLIILCWDILPCRFRSETIVCGKVITVTIGCIRHMTPPHDDVSKWKHFLSYWPFVRGIHQSPVNSPHKGQWRGAWMCSLICASINDSVNIREAFDLRRHGAHYDITVISEATPTIQMSVMTHTVTQHLIGANHMCT